MCKKCKSAYLDKYDAVLQKSEYIYIRRHLLSYGKVYVFCAEAPYVRQVPFKLLRPGDLFYKESRGKLEVGLDGEFIYRVEEGAKAYAYDRDFKPVDWVVKCDTVRNWLANTRETVRAVNNKLNLKDCS